MGVRVLALDISTCTGYGFWESSSEVSSIKAGVIELPPARKTIVNGKEKHDYSWDDWRVAQAGPKVSGLIRQFKPELVLIEERLRFSKTGDGGFAMTNAIHGAIYSHCCSWGIVFGTVNVKSWRVPAYGEGFKPPLVPDCDRSGAQKINAKTGALEWKEKDWGNIAVDKCQELGIEIPEKKAIAHNAAEAALIAMIWRCQKRITIPADRDHQRYIEMLQRPRIRKTEAA
jgi:hypothetical protein